MKLSDYIATYLNEAYHVDTVFMVTGGGAMHLNDSFGRCRSIRKVFNHHEQACAIAAEGYFRASGKLCVVNVTTGPGGLNTLTGLLGQWTDSIPVLYVSGQVRFDTSVGSCPDISLRQLGDQETDITRVVAPLVKYAAVVKEPAEIKRQIDMAIAIALEGRMGPVWLDIPMNVQGAQVDPERLVTSERRTPQRGTFDVERLRKLLEKAQRPVLLAGHGIRLSGSAEAMLSLLETFRVPVVTTFNGYDLIDSSHPLYVGRLGTVGDRAGNFAVQNSDLLLCIGTRNNIRQIGYNFVTFARSATKVIVDIDPAELEKPTIRPDLKVLMDAGHFIEELKFIASAFEPDKWSEWIAWCRHRQSKYPVALPEYWDTDELNPYVFIAELTKRLDKDYIVVAGNGTACVCLFQAGIVKKGQRCFWNSGCAAMGYDLPASIGAAVAFPSRPVVCLAGDGSLQMNVQELATVSQNDLDIKLFVLNNGGYISIKQTQENFFGKPLIGCDPESGVSFPQLMGLAAAYGIPFHRIEKKNIEEIDRVLSAKGPCICEVILQRDYRFAPKSSSERKPDGRIVSKPLEDLAPFLSREEFASNMIIAPVKE